MKTIRSTLTYIPIRKEAAHSSEQVSQLILGETAEVLDENEDWFAIKTHFDGYEGWAEKKMCFKDPENGVHTPVNFQLDLSINLGSIHIPYGAEIIIKNGEICLPGDDNTYLYEQNGVKTFTLESFANDLLGSPYLWGGRTKFGIDCSGLSQLFMKCMGVAIPRDASQQVKLGIEVGFVSSAQQGDLAFFENQEGNTTHVGIIYDKGKILHASGNVRIDKLDQEGIYNEALKRYTHQLSNIKRFLK